MCTQTNLPSFYWNATGAPVTAAVAYTFPFHISFFVRGTIISSQKHSSIFKCLEFGLSNKQTKELFMYFFCVGWVLWEEWENNFPMFHSWFFLANLDQKTKKAQNESNISSIAVEYLILCQWKPDLISVVISFWKSAAWHALGVWQCSTEWAGELAGQVTVPQHMGHQVIGDIVPAVGAFSIRMWSKNFPFYIGIFRLTNWTLAHTKAPETWAKGQIPHQHKELMPAGARLALSLWLRFPLFFFPLPSVSFLLPCDRSIVPPFCPLGWG